MGWPRLKCLALGSVHPTFLSLTPYESQGQLYLRITHPLLLAALLAVRFLSTRKSHGFFPRRATSTYSQYLQPYRISAHRGTPNLSPTLSPQLAVSRTAAPLPVQYRLSAISYRSNFVLLVLTVPMCETLLLRSYIVIKWSFRDRRKGVF